MDEEFDFVIKQGTTWARTVFWLNPDRSPVNITGASARMQIRPSPTSSIILLDLNSADGSLILGGAAGTISWSVSAEDTAAFVAPPLAIWRNPRSGEVINRLGTYDLLVTIGGSVFPIQDGVIYLASNSTY